MTKFFTRASEKIALFGHWSTIIFGPLVFLWLFTKFSLVVELSFLAACLWAAYWLVVKFRQIMKDVFGISLYKITVKEPIKPFGSYVSKNEILFHKKKSNDAILLSLPFSVCRDILSPKRKQTPKVKAFLKTKQQKTRLPFSEAPQPSPGTKIEIIDDGKTLNVSRKGKL